MELRHLRYFVAVAEEGSLTLAAERRLHTAQPSLSRQIRDLESEVGTTLLTRSVHGVALTPAGKAFLDHARLALAQVEAAGEAARRIALPGKPAFAIGFLTGQEMVFLPEVMRILGDALPSIDLVISSQKSRGLAAALAKGQIDVAFLRPEAALPELTYRLVRRERLVVVLPSDHRLAPRDAVALADLGGEKLIRIADTTPVLRDIVDEFVAGSAIAIMPGHAIDNPLMGMSLVASTRGVALLPEYVESFLPWSVVSRKLSDAAPTIDLVLGYRTANPSPVLAQFLSRWPDEFIGPVSRSGA